MTYLYKHEESMADTFPPLAGMERSSAVPEIS